MPVVADHNLGIDPKSTEYGLLYAAFGLGAALGAVSVGTLFASRSKPMLVRVALVAFAGLLALFALERHASVAYPTVIVLGFAYFVVITSLSTVLQQHLDDAVRGRIMALWIMAFGGTVPIGVVLAGFVVDPIGITTVLLVGAAVALALAAYADLDRSPHPRDRIGIPVRPDRSRYAWSARTIGLRRLEPTELELELPLEPPRRDRCAGSSRPMSSGTDRAGRPYPFPGRAGPGRLVPPWAGRRILACLPDPRRRPWRRVSDP